MAALQCEICGGRLMAKAGGIFECDSCGMQYDKTRIQEMVQEIKGTVKVEGTVEVTGKVQVDGPVKVDLSANVQSLLKRGDMALSEKKWEKAREFYQEALSVQETCWEACLGLYLETLKARDRKDFEEKCLRHYGLRKNDAYNQLQKLAPPEILQWLDDINKRHKEYLEQKALEEEVEEKRQQEDRIRRAAELKPLRERIKPASDLLSVAVHSTVCVTENGDAVSTGTISCPKWHGLSSVAAGYGHTIGLRRDGSVAVHLIINNIDENLMLHAQSWRDIVKVVTVGTRAYGLKEDGTVVGVGMDEKTASSMKQWKDIVDLAAGPSGLYGLKADGTVVSVEKKMNWNDVVSIAVGRGIVAGLTSYGEVLFSGRDSDEYMLDYQDYVAIAAGDRYLLALRADGTVDECHYIPNCKEACQVSSWKNIVAIAASEYHSVGLREDGTLVAAGRPGVSDDFQQCNVGGWKLFRDYDSFLKNYVPQKERLAHERDKRKHDLNEEKTKLQNDLMNLKGILAGMRRKQIETRLAQIETELKGL